MEKKVPKLQIIQTNIPESVENIENPTVPMALRVSGHLLLGVVRIFSKKVTYLLSDCSDALVKIKDAFRAPGGVELAPGAGTRNYDEITRHDQLDEMDLDADITQQGMLFAADDDDALVGIAIPEADADADFGAMAAMTAAGGFEEQEGFGANEDFEVFFDQPAEEETSADEHIGRAEKRQRLSDTEDDVEQFRLQEEADGRHLSGAMLDDEADAAFDDGIASQNQAPTFDEEEFADTFHDEEPTGMDAVMQDASREASSTLRRPEPTDKLPGREPPARPRQKRKMIIDDEIQLSTEQFRSQLDDPSSIVRNFAEEARQGKRNRKTGASDDEEFDPLFGGPPMPWLPKGYLKMKCFQPLSKLPSAQQSRLSGMSGADSGSAGFEEDEPDLWRSGSHAADESNLGVSRESADPLLAATDGDDTLGAERRMSEPPDFADGFEEPFGDEPLPDGLGPVEDYPVGGDLSQEANELQGAGFEPSRELPDVDADGEADDDKGGNRQGSAADTHDPRAWNPRTKRMYQVLDSAFKESSDEALSYNAMIATTRGPDKRKVVAGCFQELLFLTTHGLIELQQRKAYGNILISKTELFNDTLAPGASSQQSQQVKKKKKNA